MTDQTQNATPLDPSRRKLIKAGLAGAATFGAFGAEVATAANQSSQRPSAGRQHKMLASSLIHTGHTEAFTGRTWANWPFEYRMRQVAEAGFTGVSLLHPDLDHVFRFEAQGSSMTDKILWMKSVLDDNGLVDVEIEFLTNWMFPKGDGRREAEEPVRQMLLHMARIMRPHHLKCGNFAQPEPVEKVKAGFKILCEDFSDTVVAYAVLTNEPYGGDINTMIHIVEGNDNGGLFFDTWHTNHIDGLSYEDISNLPKGVLKGVELDDGWLIEDKYKPYFDTISAPRFLERTINCRCCLGEGNFDVVGFIKACEKAGYDGPWGNEILSQNVQRYPIEMMLPHIYNTSLAHLRNALEDIEIPRLIRSDYGQT